MLDKIPTPSSGAVCNEKTGWLPPNFDDNCREILNETVSNLIRTSENEEDEAAEESIDKEADGESIDENEVRQLISYNKIYICCCTSYTKIYK